MLIGLLVKEMQKAFASHGIDENKLDFREEQRKMQFMKNNKKLIGLMVMICLALIAAIGSLLVLWGINAKLGDKEVAENIYPSSYVDELMKASQTGVSDKVLLFDFQSYEGENQNPGGYFSTTVEMGETYTLSFEYCVVGESLGMTFVNAANEWGMGSEVSFGKDPLQGKGKMSITFTADYPYVLPVFQAHTPMGCANIYVWNLSMEKEGTGKNMLKTLGLGSFSGVMADQGLISYVDVDTDTLVGSVVEMAENPVCLFDFTKYKGKNECPGAGLALGLEIGEEYTFSYEYCLMGETTGVTCINAANEWGMGSKVKFNSVPLVGKGKSSITFKADYPTLYPVFQCFMPKGTGQLYVWNIKLVKKGTDINLTEKIAMKSFQGALTEYKGTISFVEIDTSKLEPTIRTTIDEHGILTMPDNLAGSTWLLDFEKYNGEDETPGMFFTASVETGATYTFSFDYCVIGKAAAITCVNAANEWGLGSKVKFDSNPLIGKATYSVTFQADTTEILPVIQAHIAAGKAQLYIWNMKLVKSGTPGNLMKSVGFRNVQGQMKEKGCISEVKVDTDALKPTITFKTSIANNTWLLDFTNYKGTNETPGMHFAVDVEKGQKYQFRFKYCVVGDSLGTTCINAASEWGMGSNVRFDSTPLLGKGEYSVTFKADMEQVLPAIQSHLPNGKAKVYIWDMALEKVGSGKNILEDIFHIKFQGTLVENGLVTLSKENVDQLKPTVTEVNAIAGNTWLLDFENYNGDNQTPGVFFSVGVEISKRYTFSFDYCVVGESDHTTVANASNEWGLGSNVKFENNTLSGKKTYTTTFTADTPEILPLLQSHIPAGAPKLYVWNMKLQEENSSTNLLEKVTSSAFQGDMVNEGLVTKSDVDISALKPTEKEDAVWLIDFSKYTGTNATPSAYFSVDLEKGSEYAFSFDYCVIGKSTGTTVVNAANEWGLGSNVIFSDNQLTGKGTYTTTFTADSEEVLPVLQSHLPLGKPQLYIWKMKIVKIGTDENLLKNLKEESFFGDMRDAGLIIKSDVDTSTLQPTTTKEAWLIDFSKYVGNNLDVNTFFNVVLAAGSEYTFSFEYCVKGTSTGTTVFNAANEWGLGSTISFPNNSLIGKGNYATTFTADGNAFLPGFQTHIPLGAPQLYIWDLKIIKTGTDENLLKDFKKESFDGDGKNHGFVSESQIDTDE